MTGLWGDFASIATGGRRWRTTAGQQTGTMGSGQPFAGPVGKTVPRTHLVVVGLAVVDGAESLGSGGAAQPGGHPTTSPPSPWGLRRDKSRRRFRRVQWGAKAAKPRRGRAPVVRLAPNRSRNFTNTSFTKMRDPKPTPSVKYRIRTRNTSPRLNSPPLANSCFRVLGSNATLSDRPARPRWPAALDASRSGRRHPVPSF